MDATIRLRNFYLTDVNPYTTTLLDANRAVTNSSGYITSKTTLEDGSIELTLGSPAAETHFVEFGAYGTQVTERYFVFQMYNEGSDVFAFNANSTDWNTKTTDDLVKSMADRGATLKMYDKNGNEITTLGKGQWVTLVWDLTTITNKTDAYLVRFLSHTENIKIRVRNFSLTDELPTKQN